MASIFTLESFDNFSEKINIDELYEKKRQYDVKKLELFKKILNRVHIKIKTISKMNTNERVCWYVVPEIIMGIPRYDKPGCIAYIMDSLQNNGFKVQYFHPNTIFISWAHWVPSYVRTEIKKKTGIEINEFGEKIEMEYEDEEKEQKTQELQPVKNTKKYTPITNYKPSGKLVYSDDMMDKIGNKLG
jgi:hypothetical protein